MIRQVASHAVVALALVALSGCYRVTIRSGQAEAPGLPATDGTSRGGIANGIAEEKALHAGMVCGDKFGSVHIETSLLNGLANAYRGVYYHTENITLRCAAPREASSASATKQEKM